MKSQWFWIIGGLCVGVGLLLLIGGFGDTGFGLVSQGMQQQTSASYSAFGYDASLDVQVSSNGWTGLIFLLTGLICLVGANSVAWEDTEGY